MTAGSEYKGSMGQESSLRFLEESSRNFGESGSSVLQKPTDRGLPTGCSKRMGDRSGTVPIAEEHPGCLCPPLWWTRISRQLAQMPGPRWLWWTLALAAIIGWGFADIRLRGLPWPDRPLEHKTDFTVYTAAGRAFFTGQNPYEVTNPRGWKYLYPPLFALLVAPLSLLSMADQCLVWYFLSVAFCWGCYREASRILRGFQPLLPNLGAKIYSQWVGFLGALAFLAALFPTLNCLQRGQVGILKLYLLLLGVRLAWLSAGWVGKSLGGLAQAGAIVLKLTPALAVGMVLWAQLAAVLAGWWRRQRGQIRSLPLMAKESLPTTSQSPHFAHIPKIRTGPPPASAIEERPSHFQPGPAPHPVCPSIRLAGDYPDYRSGLPSHADPPPGAMKENPGHLDPGTLPPRRSASGTEFRSFTATALGVGVGLILFFFLLPAGIVGWQKNLEHLAYWADRVFPSAGEGFPTENSLSAPDAQSNPEGFQPAKSRILSANYRTVRNQSLANAMFRLAALTDRLLLGGPDDRQLDYVAHAPNRIDAPIYQAVQKAIRAFVLVVLVLAVALLGARGGRLGPAAAFGLGCVGILVISPVSWGHYFMLLAPGILLVPVWLLERGWARAACWLAAVPPVLSILHYSLLDLVGRMGLLGLGTAGWLLAACILVLRITGHRSFADQQIRSFDAGLDEQLFETAPVSLPPVAADGG